jgi:hypothetical protein
MPISPWSERSELNPFAINRKVAKLYEKQAENVGIYSMPKKDAQKFDSIIELNDELEAELRKFTSIFSDNLMEGSLTQRVRSGQSSTKIRENSPYAGNIGTGKIISLLTQGIRMLKKFSFSGLTPTDIDTIQQQYTDLLQYMNLKDDLSQLESTADDSLSSLEQRRADARQIPSGRDRKFALDALQEEEDANRVISEATSSISNTVGSFYSQLEQYLLVLNNKITNFNTNPATKPPEVELGGGFTIGDQRYYGRKPYNVV